MSPIPTIIRFSIIPHKNAQRPLHLYMLCTVHSTLLTQPASDNDNKQEEEDIADWITNEELDTNPLLAALEDLGIHITDDLDKEINNQETLDKLLKGARKQLEDVLKPFVISINQRNKDNGNNNITLQYKPPVRAAGNRPGHRSKKSNISRVSTRSTRSTTSTTSDSSGVSGGGQPMKTSKEIESEQRQNNGRSLKQWMQSNNIFNLDVFNSLVSMGYTSVEDFADLQEKQFDTLRTKVRASTRKNTKDAKKLQRVDKTLTKVEKEWRQRSGKRKTNMDNY